MPQPTLIEPPLRSKSTNPSTLLGVVYLKCVFICEYSLETELPRSDITTSAYPPPPTLFVLLSNTPYVAAQLTTTSVSCVPHESVVMYCSLSLPLSAHETNVFS